MSGSTGEYLVVQPGRLCRQWTPGRQLRRSKGTSETQRVNVFCPLGGKGRKNGCEGPARE